MAGERHGHGMLRVNRPLLYRYSLAYAEVKVVEGSEQFRINI